MWWAIPAAVFIAGGIWMAWQYHPFCFFNALWCFIAAAGCLLTKGLS